MTGRCPGLWWEGECHLMRVRGRWELWAWTGEMGQGWELCLGALEFEALMGCGLVALGMC